MLTLMTFGTNVQQEKKKNLLTCWNTGGWVKRITPKGTDPSERQPSMLDIEWQEMCNKLSELRLNMSREDEDLIKEILKKY
jgi:hypothetical protein